VKESGHKYHSLDGLRGLAALVVVLLHYVSAFAPFLLGYGITQRHTSFDHILSTTPLQLPLAGNFAVCIFFVLSGFVLSLGFFKHKTSSVLASSASRRYFRLMIPVLGSVLLAYALLALGAMHNHQAAVPSESGWLYTFWGFPASLAHAVYQGLYATFFTTFYSFNISYNPILWTMHFELFGSFLVFMMLALFGKLANRWFFYAIFSVALLNTYYVAFIAGLAIADVFLNYPSVKDAINEKVLWFLLPFALILGTWSTDGIYPTVYSHIHAPFFSGGELEVFAHILGAVVVVLCVLRLNAVSRLFERKVMQYLGKISFSLYLTHFLVMGSLACFLFSSLLPHVGYKLTLILVFIPSMIVTFVVASLYTRYVDQPSIAFSKRIGNILMGDAFSLPQFKLPIPKRQPPELSPLTTAAEAEEATN
jgi:peptidoglycan/LPS O-acetylase OafA/YrhL